MALKYKEIAALLRQQILSGIYPPDSLLPTEQQLCAIHDVSRQTINAIESGKFVPSTILALKIAKIFDKAVEEVFQLEEDD